VKTARADTNFPAYFFPSASPKMKQCFWQCLIVEKTSVHDALMQYSSGAIKTPIEQEFAEMIIQKLELDWANFCVVDKLKDANLT